MQLALQLIKIFLLQPGRNLIWLVLSVLNAARGGGRILEAVHMHRVVLEGGPDGV